MSLSRAAKGFEPGAARHVFDHAAVFHFLRRGGGDDGFRLGYGFPSAASPSLIARLRSHSERLIAPRATLASSSHSRWSTVDLNPGRSDMSSNPLVPLRVAMRRFLVGSIPVHKSPLPNITIVCTILVHSFPSVVESGMQSIWVRSAQAVSKPETGEMGTTKARFAGFPF
jgi:hypothetical protein